MSEELFLFTIAGVQQLIGEARRMGDLVAGSRLMSRLSCSAAQAVAGTAGARLVFPPDPSPDQMPNRFVARVPAGSAREMARLAREALEQEWHRYADRARDCLKSVGPSPDAEWDGIWKRQLGSYWETYWVSAVDDRGYADAYRRASEAMDARKRTRDFAQLSEDGLKDTLSGTRSALRTSESEDAWGYWAAVASNVSPSQLRPGGRERLDTLGAVKRFGGLVERSVPSVSSVAAADFLSRVRDLPALVEYRKAIADLLGSCLYTVSSDPAWPYDGDLLFPETLGPGRLKDSYHLEQADPDLQRRAVQALRGLYKAAESRPSPYYGIICLDGDGMGEWVGGCRSEEAHASLSRQVTAFAEGAGSVVGQAGGLGTIIYAGGDDVLVVAPLSAAIPLGMALARSFEQHVAGATASAGVALVHHLYPLDSALEAARAAETAAKSVNKKAAVGVAVVRRSGQRTLVRSRWDGVQQHWEPLVRWFGDGGLSSRFAYDVWSTTRELLGEPEGEHGPDAPAKPPEWVQDAFESLLKRLVSRHRADRADGPPASAAGGLASWARDLPEGPLGLAHWLLLARFVAGGGRE